MVTESKIVRIVIASPGDVSEERNSVPGLFTEWNNANAKDGVQLHPKMWETAAVPEYGDHPQHVINRQIIEEGDLLVALFWTKVGSPTPTAKSGTIEEIREFIRAKGGRRVMVYFCNREIAQSPDQIDHDAIRILQEFKREIRDNCLYAEFDPVSELHYKLYRHLDTKVDELLTGKLPTPSEILGLVDSEPWWDADAIDERLRQPCDFGITLPSISSGFAAQMDGFDEYSGFTNDKYLNLGAHVYRSTARSLKLYLKESAYTLPVGIRPRVEQLVLDLDGLANESDSYTKRPFPEFWHRGRNMSNEIAELANQFSA